MNERSPLRRARPVLLALLLLAGSAQAQLLAEVMTVTATASTLNPAISLPSGSLRVTGEIPQSLLGKVQGADGYGDWEAYTATGLAKGLFPAHLHNLTTAFAAAGYWETSRTETNVNGERHVRQEFGGADGGSMLLYVIETDSEMIWLMAQR